MTRRLAVIGYPLAHTLSPAIHQAAIQALDLDLTYDAVETPVDRLAAFMTELRSEDWLGCNVTVPHKQAVMEFLDRLLPEARDIGAVNTICKSGRELIGANTDAAGFLDDVQAQLGRVQDKSVGVLGAGGAARAVCWALRKNANVSEIWIVNRSPERARDLVQRFDVKLGGREQLVQCQLIVNCTSAGLHDGDSPIADEWLPQGANLYDLIYNPPETRLMKAVRQRGGTAVNGLGMLVRQAAASFEVWTGRQPPLDLMFQAAEDALRERAHA